MVERFCTLTATRTNLLTLSSRPLLSSIRIKIGTRRTQKWLSYWPGAPEFRYARMPEGMIS